LIPVIELEVSGEVIVATCESGFEKLTGTRIPTDQRLMAKSTDLNRQAAYERSG